MHLTGGAIFKKPFQLFKAFETFEALNKNPHYVGY